MPLIFVCLIGCPSFRVTAVSIAPEAAVDATFTLAATVEVTEEDPPIDDDGTLDGGRGVLGVWLPPGWEAIAARGSGADDAGMVELISIEDGDGHFPPSFPYVEGTWFAFVSDCEHLPEGVYEYQIEVDALGPDGATEVTLGLATAQFDDGGSNGPVPTEVSIDLVAETATVREPPPAPASAGLDECESIPYGDAKGNSCSCTNLGSRPTRPTLLDLLLAII